MEDSPKRLELMGVAADWLAALDAGSADTEKFEHWRDADVRHAVAFAEVAVAWRQLDALRTLRDTAFDQQRETQAMPAPRPTPLTRRTLLRGAAAAGACVAVAGGLSFAAAARTMETTAIGQRSTVHPAQGVAVDLNTDSCVAWRMRGAARELWLERGEAAIEIMGGSEVHSVSLYTPAGVYDLRPGVYNARLREQACELTVISGEASVVAERKLVQPSQVALTTRGRTLRRTDDAIGLERTRAWRRDTIVLAGESLDYAVGEYNRYLAHKIVLGDPALSRVRIGGTFSTTDAGTFLRALNASFNIRATRDPAGGVILTPTEDKV